MTDTIVVRHDSGDRFTATTRGYTAVAGKGDPDKGGEDGMFPGELFIASLGMCIGAYVVSYCRNHGLSYEGMTIEMLRETADNPRRVKRVEVRVRMPSALSEKDRQILLRVADRCYVTQSIVGGMEIDVAISSSEDAA